MTKREQLEHWGFLVGDRDPNFNRAFVGKFMVIESHEKDEGPTDDGSNGPWCVVGDNLDALIETAWNSWADHYAAEEKKWPSASKTAVSP